MLPHFQQNQTHSENDFAHHNPPNKETQCQNISAVTDFILINKNNTNNINSNNNNNNANINNNNNNINNISSITDPILTKVSM